MKLKLDRVGCFKLRAGAQALPPTNSMAPCPQEIKEERWHRFMQNAAENFGPAPSKKKVGLRQQVMIDESEPTGGKGRSEGRCARRSTAPVLCRQPPPLARRRDRHM